ncbi:MAG: arginine--tRNA ligase [Patescibacteria group bacterium]
MNLLDIKKALESKTGFEFVLNKDLKNGLLSTNQAFIEAKNTKNNPNLIATELTKQINFIVLTLDQNLVAKQTGPYVNIDLVDFDQEEIDFAIPKQNNSVLLDYISPNVAKELHLGHLRNMNIGDSIRKLLLLQYSKVITDNHWGDWGVQFGKLIWAFKKFQDGHQATVTINEVEQPVNIGVYNDNPLQGLVRMYIWSEQNKNDHPNFEQEVRDEFLRLEEGDKLNYQLWQEFIKVSQAEVTKDMELFGVPKHDIEQGESYYEKYNDSLYNFFEDNSIWESEGRSRFINFENLAQKMNKPEYAKLGFGYLISSTGYTTYLFRDICARIDWTGHLNTDIMITVTGNEQTHHFKQIIAICDYLSTIPTPFKNSKNLKKECIIHIPYGFLSLKGGQKMSTRKGIVHTVRNMYETVYNQSLSNLKEKSKDLANSELNNTAHALTIAAIKWVDLSKDSIHDITFDINEILSFEGNTGMYQLYTFARIKSILKQNKSNYNEFIIQKLNHNEKEILKKLISYSIILDDSSKKLKPHMITNFCFELTNLLNSWYNTTSITKELDLERKESLLFLLNQFVRIHEHALNLIGIEPLEKI